MVRAQLSATERLVQVAQELSLARELRDIMSVVREAARELTGADGATFVLRDGDQCFYAEENAISPLWKGRRFPIQNCISGWTMLHRKPVVIEDIYSDPRIPEDAYRPTFVKSLAMVPIRTSAPVGAIGNYWAQPHRASEGEVKLLSALGDLTSVALENVQLYGQLQQRVREAGDAVRAREEFISIAAHELRTPLTSIVGYLDLFSEGRFGDLPPMIARPMASVRRNAHRLKRLVDDMLDVSRIESGRMVLRRGSVALGDVVRDVVTELLPLANARKQRVITDIDRIEPIDADRDKLHQIGVNLVSNAIRYTPEQGEIQIAVDEAPRDRYPGGWARLRVRDNGVGIADEDRQRIFDPFLSTAPVKHHTSAGPDSAGLGLYIARGLIELHGGLITVDSQPDVFTEFTVLLPFRQRARRDADPSEPPAPPESIAR